MSEPYTNEQLARSLLLSHLDLKERANAQQPVPSTPDEQRWLARVKELEWRAELARLVLAGDTRALSERLAQGPAVPPLCRAWLIAPGETVALPGGFATNASAETLQVQVVRGELHVTTAHLFGLDPSTAAPPAVPPATPADEAWAGYLDELEQVCKAATPGPWEYAEDASAVLFGEGAHGGIVCEFPDPAASATERDAAFIAAARDALPKLLGRLFELQSRTQSAQRAIDRVKATLAEFGDDPAEALTIVAEALSLADHYDRHPNAPRAQ